MSGGSKKSARPRGGGKYKPHLQVPVDASVLWSRAFPLSSIPYSSYKLHMFRQILVGAQVGDGLKALQQVYTKTKGIWCPHTNKLRYPKKGSLILMRALDTVGKLPHETGSKIYVKSMSVQRGTHRRPAHAIRHAQMRSFACQSRFSHVKLQITCLKQQ